jgi:succinyl-CoA synthetase alpha subunit
MARAEKVIAGLYRDSVALMELSARLSNLPGVARATAVMATAANIALLAEAGLVAPHMPPHPNDILIVVEGVDESLIVAAMRDAESYLREAAQPSSAARGIPSIPIASLHMALEDMPKANLALISTPGEHAAAEAEKALRLGLNVMIFSANVPLADEIALKRTANERGLLLMGPDCGSAVLNGMPLGFANLLRRGPVGVVSAAGTGLQQVTCLIDRAGLGISHALGCGGRDLSDEVGGSTMLQGLRMLAEDSATQIIVLVGKHPSVKTARRILDAAREVGKPVVINFLGLGSESRSESNLHVAETLEDAAQSAIRLARGGQAPLENALSPSGDAQAARVTPYQKYVRGLFSGGTLCYEAQLLLARDLGRVWSNVPMDPHNIIPDVWKSREHTLVDLGDGIFTRGRPHPMIDQRLRLERLAQESRDRETLVILFDVVLGYGAHPNPAEEIADAMAATQRDRADRHSPIFVASVCGTQGDPQNLQQQESVLREAGVVVQPSNAAAARFAAGVVVAQSRQAASR